jgi:electron transfer flavoprotein-quinone oxidoreductase
VPFVEATPGLAASRQRPEQILTGLKTHPAIEPLVRNGDLKEYSAHLIPEGGYDAMPRLAADGLLVAGDAAGLCLAAGLYLEGVNFAIGSGMAAAETALDALARCDTTAAGALAGYRRRLESNFVLADHKKLRRLPDLVLSERVQRLYPGMACNLVEQMFTVTNPQPKRGVVSLARDEVRRSGLRLRDLAKDTWAGLRSLG